MECIYDYNELRADTARPRIVTIGNFDGVHVGHQAVLAKASRDAKRHGLELAVLTFEPHPAELLKPDGPRLRLVEPERKAELIAECGADLLLAQRFDREFAQLSAERFTAEVLVRSLGATEIIVGENFRFGRGRIGDVHALREFGRTMGFQVSGEQLVRSRKADISSSRIRQLLQLGNLAVASILLGRPHEIPGTVMPGRKEGRSLGFPTINLGDVRVLVPGPGIYAAQCVIGGDIEMAAAYIGDRPTMGHGFSIEAHLLDYDKDLYGQRVVLRFIERVRDDMKFENLDELKEQMSRDVDLIREILEKTGG